MKQLGQELLKIFNEKKEHIGTASRDAVHKQGLWHEVFHCWFISKDEVEPYIYLQLRSEEKKEYPNLYDITAAGHLLADETVEDGVREIEEEIGLTIPFNELTPLGTTDYIVENNDLIDKEISHLFMYGYDGDMDELKLQPGEVSGMIKAPFEDFYKLWFGKIDKVLIKGYHLDDAGTKLSIEKTVGKESFVPHPLSFYQEVVKRIKNNLG